MGLPEIVQAAKCVDGTERYLMRMADGETVETVWMPDGDGGERGDGSEAAAEEAEEDRAQSMRQEADDGDTTTRQAGDTRELGWRWRSRGFGGLRSVFRARWGAR